MIEEKYELRKLDLKGFVTFFIGSFLAELNLLLNFDAEEIQEK